jgi:hypothetical protein
MSEKHVKLNFLLNRKAEENLKIVERERSKHKHDTPDWIAEQFDYNFKPGDQVVMGVGQGRATGIVIGVPPESIEELAVLWTFDHDGSTKVTKHPPWALTRLTDNGSAG